MSLIEFLLLLHKVMNTFPNHDNTRIFVYRVGIEKPPYSDYKITDIEYNKDDNVLYFGIND